MATNVVVTHADSSTDTYSGFMAGISNNQGDGWKLSIIPTDPTQPSLIISLQSGDNYQVTGTEPSQTDYAATANSDGIVPNPDLITNEVLPVGTTVTIS